MVAASYRMGLLTFPSIPTKLRLKPFDLGKMIGAFVHAEPTLPRELKRHLFTIEEKILESLAWQPGSSIYKLLELATVDAQELARRQGKGAAAGAGEGAAAAAGAGEGAAAAAAEAAVGGGPVDMVMDKGGDEGAGGGGGRGREEGMVVEGGGDGDDSMVDVKQVGSDAVQQQQQQEEVMAHGVKGVAGTAAAEQEAGVDDGTGTMESVEEAMLPDVMVPAAAEGGGEGQQQPQQQQQQGGSQGTRRRREGEEEAVEGAAPMDTDSGPGDGGAVIQSAGGEQPSGEATITLTAAGGGGGGSSEGAAAASRPASPSSANPSSSSGGYPLGRAASAAKRHKGQDGAVSEDAQQRQARLELPKQEYPLPKAVGAPQGMEGWVPPSGDASARAVVLDYCRKVLKLAAFRLVALR